MLVSVCEETRALSPECDQNVVSSVGSVDGIEHDADLTVRHVDGAEILVTAPTESVTRTAEGRQRYESSLLYLHRPVNSQVAGILVSSVTSVKQKRRKRKTACHRCQSCTRQTEIVGTDECIKSLKARQETIFDAVALLFAWLQKKETTRNTNIQSHLSNLPTEN